MLLNGLADLRKKGHPDTVKRHGLQVLKTQLHQHLKDRLKLGTTRTAQVERLFYGKAREAVRLPITEPLLVLLDLEGETRLPGLTGVQRWTCPQTEVVHVIQLRPGREAPSGEPLQRALFTQLFRKCQGEYQLKHYLVVTQLDQVHPFCVELKPGPRGFQPELTPHITLFDTLQPHLDQAHRLYGQFLKSVDFSQALTRF